MAQYKEVRSLAAVDAAYIAGLIDGEGTVTLSRRHAKDRRQLVVSIANTEIRLLEFVLERVGAGKITRKRTTAMHHTPSCTYAISNRQALALVEQLYPFLHSHKRERVRLVLTNYKSAVPRNGKYRPSHEMLREKFEREFFAITSREASRVVHPVHSPERNGPACAELAAIAHDAMAK
jgi:hypothetical protein